MAEMTGIQVQLVKQGGPFEIVQSPKPVPASNEVVVKLKAVALNPVDWKQMRFGVMIPKYPAILGLDGAGIIDAVGADVKDIKVGDEVASHHTAGDRGGAYQEFAAVKATEVSVKPPSWSFEDAASVPVAFITAVSALHESLGVVLPFLRGGRSEGFKPRSVLVVGGSSAVGATSVELLRLALPETIILATCSEPHHSRVVDLGADKAFDPKSSDVLEAIRNASPGGDGVEAILDVVNGVAVQPALLELLTGPKLFAELLTGANIDTKAILNGVTHRVAGLINIIGKPYAESVFPSLTDLLVGGKFKLPVRVEVAGKGFDAIEPALKRLMGGVSGTKLVVSV